MTNTHLITGANPTDEHNRGAQPSGLNGFACITRKPRLSGKSAAQWKVVPVGEPFPRGQRLDSPELANGFWRERIDKHPFLDLSKEHLVVVCLNTRYFVDGFTVVSTGSINESIAHPRDIFRPAVLAGSYAVICMHNHPSGDPSPSQTDHSLTRRLAEAGELLQIKLLDHVIVGGHGACFQVREGVQQYFSFKEAGVL